jgi:hypothetical protein
MVAGQAPKGKELVPMIACFQPPEHLQELNEVVSLASLLQVFPGTPQAGDVAKQL